MKRIFKRFTDVVGHLPDSFKPKEDAARFTTLSTRPSKKDMKQYRVVVYDVSSHREEGMPIVPVWEREIPSALISGLIAWVKTQVLALQYYPANPYIPIRRDVNGRPLTHDSTGRVREGNRIFHSDLVNYDAWSDSIRRDHSTVNEPIQGEASNRIAERARQLADEMRARGIDPDAPVNPVAEPPLAERHRQLIDEVRTRRILATSNPETESQRWARERWERSLAGRALAMHQGHEAREADSVHDVYLRDEYQPDRNNRER